MLTFQDCFGYSRLFAILDEFLNQLVNFYEEIRWDSVRNCVKTAGQFGECYHFNNKSSNL